MKSVCLFFYHFILFITPIHCFLHLGLLWWSNLWTAWGQNHRATAIPKFGTWDVTNPKSAEGYTAIFSKIKEERQIKSSHVSSIHSTPPLNNSNIKNQYGESSSWLSKVMRCCVFQTIYPHHFSFSLKLY